nr:uncharacterized protein LOC111414120 [Onthophagus taurus]
MNQQERRKLSKHNRESPSINSLPTKLSANALKLLQNVYGDASTRKLPDQSSRFDFLPKDLTNRDLIDRNDKKDDDNLQKLRKRINKLSKKVIDAEKGTNLVKLYDKNPNVTDNGPIDILDKLKRIRLDKDAKLMGDDHLPASILKRKNQINITAKNSSSSSSTHSIDLQKSRKKDILRLIKEKEAASLRFGGDESDVETALSENHLNKRKKNVIKEKEQTLVDLASSLHKIHSKYSASSVPMNANSRRTAKSVLTKSAKQIDVKITSKYSIRSSLANIFGGSIDNEQNKPNPISVPDYLEQLKSSRKNKKKTKVKKVNKKDGRGGEVKLKLSASRSKLTEDVKPLKVGGIKKESSGKKKKKKEHVLFTEAPEVINTPSQSKEEKSNDMIIT